MLRSHLFDAFTQQPWNLHGEAYDGLADLLEAHAYGSKDDWRATATPMANLFYDDGENPRDETGGDRIEDGLAIIQVRGILARHADQVNGACMPQGRSYDSLIAQMRLAASDPRVRAQVLVIETPGGAAVGCQEWFDAINEITAQMPVVAYVDGGCYSAGVYGASACTEVVFSSVAAGYGSIGTLQARWDTSEAAAKAGRTRKIFRTDPTKAPGQDGEAYSELADAEIQRQVNMYGAAFYDAVRAGRGLDDEQAAQALCGRTWMATDAIALGLGDRIETFTQLCARLRSETSPTAPKGNEMSIFGKPKKNDEPQAGLSKEAYAALAAEFPTQLDLLASLDGEGKNQAEIVEALLRDRLETVIALNGKLEEDLAASIASHNEDRAANEAKIAELQADLEKARNFTETETATADAGSDAAAEAALGNPTSDTALQAKWASMSKESQMEWCNSFDAFAYAMKHPELNRQAAGSDD